MGKPPVQVNFPSVQTPTIIYNSLSSSFPDPLCFHNLLLPSFFLSIYFYLHINSTRVSIFSMRKPCCDKQDTNKGAWSKQEDQKLIDYIRKHGEGCWRTLPQAAGLLRCGKSCRLRWINYLRPDLKRGNFAEDEEDLIIKLHALLGNRWSLIAGRLPGRTDNEVKNYWNSHLRRKLINMGIDPNNHRLNHSLPRPAHPILTSIETIQMKNDMNNTQRYDNDQVSDARSCLDDETPRGSLTLPDLNLDLSMSFPSPSSSLGINRDEDLEKKNQH